MSVQPRQVIQDALYQLGIVTDILGVVASADISGTKRVCGTYIEYLAARQREQQDRIEHALADLGRP